MPSRTVISLALLLVLGARQAEGQALTGTESLIRVPTAELPDDGTVTVGGGFMHRKHLRYGNGRYHITPYFFSITFLPFVELTLRFNRTVNPAPSALGDRTAIVRLRLLRETPRRPAVLVGVQDFIGDAPNFGASYIVVSKNLSVAGLPAGFHAGYGTRWIDARRHEYAGLFGGLSVSLMPFVDLILEYDGNTPNAAARLTLLDRFTLLTALQGMDAFALGACARVRL